MSDSEEIIKHSVTRQEQEDLRALSGGVYYFLVPPSPGSGAGLPPTPPRYWSHARDQVLGTTPHYESMWGSALHTAITKIASTDWLITDALDSQLRVKRAQDLLLYADAGMGWVQFISKHLKSYLCRDNGAVIEVVRASTNSKSRVLGLVHLSSLRCIRTGDIERPIIYQDRFGRWHEMKAHQVLMLSDMPSDEETFFDVGFCAASRAYRTIYKLAGIEQYVTEKVTGSRALAIHLLYGVTDMTMQSIIATAESEQARKGAYSYRGAIMGTVPGDTPAQLVTIPLSELPDGFDPKQERDNAYLIYANALGVPVQDIQPLSGQGLGTGAQAVILAEAAQGQGLAAWRKQFTHFLNMITSESTTFAFSSNDTRDQKAKAEVSQMRATTRKTQIESGEINPQEARQMAADDGDIPRDLLVTDATPGGSVSDSEKPVTESVTTDAQQDPALQLQSVKASRRWSKQMIVSLLDDPEVIARVKHLRNGRHES